MNIDSWLNKNIDLSLIQGKTFLITGANSGIGFELAKILSKYRVFLIFAVRNLERGNKAKEEILAIYPHAYIKLMQLDLADMESIKDFANKIIKEKIDIDYFINNAGVYRLPYSLTKQGLEIQMGTNFYGTLMLNELLLPYLNGLPHKIKVTFINSVTCYYYKYDINNLFPPETNKPIVTYANSKTATIHIFEYYLNKYQDSNLEFYLVHPGATYTPLIDKGYKNQTIRLLGRKFMKIFLHSPKKASLIYIQICKDIPNGSYVGPRGLAQLSGFPKILKLKQKYIKEYNLTLENGLKTIEKFKR